MTHQLKIFVTLVWWAFFYRSIFKRWYMSLMGHCWNTAIKTKTKHNSMKNRSEVTFVTWKHSIINARVQPLVF